jgi:hypothetical protein
MFTGFVARRDQKREGAGARSFNTSQYKPNWRTDSEN